MKHIFPILAVLFCSFTNPPVCPQTDQNAALQRSKFLLCQLAWPQLYDSEKIEFQQQYWNLLAESGPEFTYYGSITGGPITTKSPTNMPSVSTGVIVDPAATAWSRTGLYLPTNDWIENIAAYPTAGKDSDNGFHKVVVATNGIQFQMALKFYDWGTALHSMIQISSWDPGFKLGAVGYTKPFLLKWNHEDTGNLVRQAYYDDGFSVFITQGGFFQGASYQNVIPDIGFVLQNSMKSTLPDGTIKYKVVKPTAIYLIYANSQFVPGMPYMGNLNVAVIPNNSSEAGMESLCDLHANAVVVKAQGTLLPNGTYSFQYLSQDLKGVLTATQPLILLKSHHVNTLLPFTTSTDSGFSLNCITGPVEIYAGSTFVFQPKVPRSIDPAPNLPNGGNPLTLAQAQELCATGGPLDQQIASILAKYKSSSSVYGGGKIDYQIALTLHYGVKSLQIAGLPLDRMMPLYQRLRTILVNKLYLYQYDTQFSGIVSKINDYGDHSDYNDHIVQYGYDLMSFAILKNFEDQNIPANQRLMNQQVSLAGYGMYTYMDMADLIAADMGELSHQDSYFPIMRNLDTYIGHSWLSGLGSKNTESQSEAVLGSWSVAYWLTVRQAPVDQIGVALTRFALETQSLNVYNHIGNPSTSVFNGIAPVFTANHPVVSITWGNSKLGDETYWGLEWDRIFACEFMPASANTMDSMLDFEPAFAQRGADYILANWSNFDTGNNIQSVLIPIVSKVYGTAKATALIDDVAARNKFDDGTNAFILRYINYYGENERQQN